MQYRYGEQPKYCCRIGFAEVTGSCKPCYPSRLMPVLCCSTWQNVQCSSWPWWEQFFGLHSPVCAVSVCCWCPDPNSSTQRRLRVPVCSQDVGMTHHGCVCPHTNPAEHNVSQGGPQGDQGYQIWYNTPQEISPRIWCVWRVETHQSKVTAVTCPELQSELWSVGQRILTATLSWEKGQEQESTSQIQLQLWQYFKSEDGF